MSEHQLNKQKQHKAIPVIEEQGRALMQAVPDLVFLLGLDGRYIDIFSAADEDLFLPPEQLIGRTVLEVLPPPVGEDCMAAIGALSSPKDVSSFSYELQIGGTPRWFEGRVALCGKDAVIVLVRDFTEQRLAEHNLREANTSLQRRARQLQQLEQELTRVEQRERRRMAQLLHDNLQQLLVGAKFNLTLLAGSVKIAEDQQTAEKVIEILDKVIEQSRLLTTELYPSILYEGSLEQSLAWIKNHVASLHGLKLKITSDVGHKIRLSESVRFTMFNAILELLLNVTKHSGSKEAVVAVSTHSAGSISISVSDQGQGFDPQTIEQGDETMENFGLFLLRERFSWLGGQVEIFSKPGAGCTVTLSLPIEIDNVIENHSPISSTNSSFTTTDMSTSSPVRSKGPLRIILADDHTIVREGLIQILQKDDLFSVIGEAPDGETAVALAQELNPDVVLMDISMPGIGGAEATRRIKSANPGIHVIALSMHEESERGSEMLDAGATKYISKSRAASTIGDAIRSCCGSKIQDS